mmetsp:Transcript_15473/g.33528  ORF Transcript_15473/g.33528 Transcript_15473/m.33528 type:complete len:367 (-) Transcript_15473:151-1251(-)
MGKEARRAVIETSMQQFQRLELENFVKSASAERGTAAAQRGRNGRTGFDRKGKGVMQGDGEHKDDENKRQRGGICKCCDQGRVYGHYAKVSYKNLVFWGHVHKDPTRAVQDHIILSKVTEHMSDNKKGSSFMEMVNEAWRLVLHEEGLTEKQFLRGVSVTVAARHWIGQALSTRFGTLAQALDAWKCLEDARGVPLFYCNTITANYTLDAALQQWKRLRQAFLHVQSLGSKKSLAMVEQHLSFLEGSYRPVFLRKARALERQRCLRYGSSTSSSTDASDDFSGSSSSSSNNTDSSCSSNGDIDSALKLQCESILRDWDRAVAKTKLRQNAAARRQALQKAEAQRKRRWNGKESLDEFQRRSKLNKH